MPVYEYVCLKCRHAFEHLAKTFSAPPPACPKCGAKKPVKQFSLFSPATATQKKPSPGCAESCPSASACAARGCAGGNCPIG